MALLYTVAFALPVDAFAYSRAIPCGWPAGTNKCWQAIPCGWPAGLRPADKRREDRGSTGCGFIISARRVAGPRRLVATGRGQLCLAALILVEEAVRFSTPIPLHRLQIAQEIPLPDALPDPHRTAQNPFAPGQAQRFDHFDFQSYDPATHLLFIVHTGPNPDKEAAILHNPDFDAETDGNIVVFNTQLNRVVGLVDIPQAAGVLVVPELGKVFAGDAGDGIIYVFSEQSPFKILDKIKLDPSDSPDAIEYDPTDQRIFVSDPGAPISPDDANIALKNQNVAVIDATDDKLIGKIQIGVHKPFGDDVGHIQYDPVTHRIFLVTLPLVDQN